MEYDVSSSLLKRLCSHITGITSGDKALDQYELAVNLLKDGDYVESFTDFSLSSDKIKKWLVKENRLGDAARLSVLLSNLQRSNVLSNKTAILNLFLYLHQPNSLGSSRTDSEISLVQPAYASGNILNGHCPIRSLSLHSFSSKESTECVSSRNNVRHSAHDVEMAQEEDYDKSCGRVARLAALYKADGAKVTGHQLKKGNILKPINFSNSQTNQDTRKEWLTHTDVSENVLIREILFSFQGIEGKVIKRDVANESFKIDPKVRLSVGQRDLVNKLVEIGCLYSKINRFCEASCRNFGGGNVRQSNQIHSQHVNSAGLVNQSLILAVKEELNEYCRLIAVLESQIQETASRDSSYGEGIGGQTLRRLLLWTLEPRCRLRTLALIIHSVRNVKGGASAAALYQHLHHGDEAHVQVVRHALSQACRPLFVMLTEWLLDGNLQDPHQEFFIAADSSISNERMWHDKYAIRWCMLPSFVSLKQAQKVLAAGKSLNFLRHVCNFKSAIGDRESIKAAVLKTSVESLFNQNETNQLDDLISLTFRSTSSHVLEEILHRHKLLDHLTALRRYILLGQGDFIHYLMEILAPELSKPANSLHSHNLSFLLETAITASNVQYEAPDILKRLDVRLLECSPGETGWDVFSLDYHVDGPIGTVFTDSCMRQYLMLFNSLWRAKHMECILSATWKQQAATSKLCRDIPELGGALHCIQLLLTEMIHLVQQMAYYMTFEVLECSWHALTNQLTSAQSLDDVIGAHSQFLKKIVAGALLDEDSREIRTHLRTLYDLMVRLECLQEKLYNAVVSEVNARKAVVIAVEERTKAGQFGTCSELEEREEIRRNEFSSKFVPSFRSDLIILKQSYQDMVQYFLLMLAENEDENLHLLSTRLDFNEHYHRKDHRLNMRLTYLHKRKSMGASMCQ